MNNRVKIGKAELCLRTNGELDAGYRFPVDILAIDPSKAYRIKGEAIIESLVSKDCLAHIEMFSPEVSEPCSLNLRSMLTGDLNRIRYAKRYSTSLVIHSEGVAEHCLLTSLYALFIAKWYNDSSARSIGESASIAGVLSRALLHDIEEALTGDMPRSVKYSSPEMLAVVRAFAEKCAKHLLNSIQPENNLFIFWENAKDDTLEGSIVALADFLSVLSYLSVEIVNMNFTIQDFYSSMQGYSAIFEDKRFDPLRPIIVEAKAILSELCARVKVNADGI